MRRLLLFLALAAALLTAGCGSSEPRLTKAEFTQRANAVCSRYVTLVRGMMSGITPGNVAQVQARVAQALPVIRVGNDELRALRPPAELQDAYDRLLDTSDRQLGAIEKLEKALQERDAAGMTSAITTLASTDVEQQRLDVASLGLTACRSATR